MLFIPTAFDLIATVLMNVGLLSGGRWPLTLARAQPGSLHKQQGSNAAGHRAAQPHLLMQWPSHAMAISCNGTTAVNVFAPAVTASVYQMMRGAEMLFAALFAVVFLRRWCGRGLAGRQCWLCSLGPPMCAGCSVLTGLLLTLSTCVLAAA